MQKVKKILLGFLNMFKRIMFSCKVYKMSTKKQIYLI